MYANYISHAILVVLLLGILTIPYRESFQQASPSTKEIVLTTQKLNFQGMLKDYKLTTIAPSGWEYLLFKLYTKQASTIYGNPNHIILDPVDYIENATSYPKIDLAPGYFFVFTSPNKKDDFQCGFDFTGKKIGYFDPCERRFIETILYGYRTVGKAIPLSLEKLPVLDSIWDTIDVLVMYLLPKSPLCKLIETQDLYLLDLSSISMDRLQVTHPYLSLQTIPKEKVFSTNNRITTISSSMAVIQMNMVLVNITPPITTTETFITSLQLSPEFTDPTFRCIGDETIQSSALCKSPYDLYGNPKPMKTSWDKPCKKNEECPFYKANKNYPNERGKCLPDGTCEMPLGITRNGFTKYFDRDPYQPFCYQCKNVKDKDCCNAQQAQVEFNKQNPNAPPQTYLKSADYAFKEDTEERQLYKLPTYIPLSLS